MGVLYIYNTTVHVLNNFDTVFLHIFIEIEKYVFSL